ncbi:MAG: hydroxymethylglutaryl-CoA reductase, degradative [Bacteriovoracaceae bacterium]|nr:hydroxymethylglutaryl-CoA reductase, degradative [Bacteriovoracaceae bacterium]
MKTISGFSKLSKNEKIEWLAQQLSGQEQEDFLNIKDFWHSDEQTQKVMDDFSENTISNFYFPFGIAPNFSINDKVYHVPMVIEESSVVAAASKSAKFWLSRGGFKAKVVDSTKAGQVHFIYQGDKEKLFSFFNINKINLKNAAAPLAVNMEKRGGGIKDISLRDKTDSLENYYQLDVTFDTCDAMGANFINSILESFAQTFQDMAAQHTFFNEQEQQIQIIMSILTNYTPECRVVASVECDVEQLGEFSGGMDAFEFAQKFERAVQIAKVDVNRAVTHNKGILNGIDAVVLATGNDFRAVEACVHAYAARDGQYRSLSSCTVKDNKFKFELDIPLALGTVGGLTSLHPMAKTSLSVLGHPDAKELMMITACVGLAQNFGAVRSLVTTGIQKGHMKMHLLNILNQLEANEEQISLAKDRFEDHAVSFAAVREFLAQTAPAR